MELDQSFLSELPDHHRQKVCKQIRQKQIEKYVKFIKSERGQEFEPRRQNKRHANVHFGTNLMLQTAVDEFDDVQVSRFLSEGGDPNFITGNGTTLLHKCAAEDNVSAAELLLGAGANVNATDDDWWTPLHTACSCDSVEIVQLLLNNGANLGAIDVDGYFPIDQAADDSEAKAIVTRHLEKLGMSVDMLHQNRQVRPKEMLNHIKSLPLAVDVNMLNSQGVTLLHIAAANGYRSCLKALFKYDPNVNKLDSYGWTPLHVAARFNQTKSCELLLKRKANPNIKDSLGSKPSAVTSSDELRALLMRFERKFRESHPLYLDLGSSEEDIATTVREAASTKTNEPSEASEGNVYDEIEEFKVRPDVGAEDLPPVEFRPTGVFRINSKTARAKHSSISKEDELLEAKKNESAVATMEQGDLDIALPPPPAEMLQDDDEENDDDYDYISHAIWKSGASQKGQLAKCMDTDNLTGLANVREDAILTELKNRYAARQIYTYIGDVLIAVNPFTELQYYSKDISQSYHNSDPSQKLPPHIYGIAECSHHALVHHGKSQCHVISGESGSGKTESCKYIIQHLLRVAGSVETNLNTKINQVNPLLEAFGNAVTVMNNNSSRFGKFVELHFSPAGKVIGAQISEYMLEKSRIVHQGRGECNFHIFYWMMAALSPEEVTVYRLHDMHKFRYLSSTKPQNTSENKAKFLEVKDCLKYIGFSTADIQNVFQTLSIVLHLGEITFQGVGNNDAAQVHNADMLKTVSDMLEVSAKELGSALVADYTVTRGEQIKKERTVEQAGACRDALAKTLYARLFSWIVNGINQMIQSENPSGDLQVGILDIFGFENFSKNSFEQEILARNKYRPVSLSRHDIFMREHEDCLLEGVTVVDVDYTSNQAILDLFLERPTGLLSILDEESNFPKATDKSLATKLHQNTGKKHSQFYKTPRDGGLCFTVVHYAGSVSYDVTGVLEKNRDTLPNSVLYTMKTSNRLLVKELFQSRVTRTGSLAPSARQQRSRRTTIKKSASPFEFFKKFKANNREPKKPMKTVTVEKKGPSTMAYHFRNSLADLINKLQSCEPHFVRCIKPNTNKEALSYVPEYVLAQMRYTGISEIVKIRKYGYALRLTYHEFLTRYPAVVACCLPKFCPMPDRQKCSAVLDHYQIKGAQFGKSKLFLKIEHVERLDQLTDELEQKVTRAQSVVRGFLGRQLSKRLSEARDQERQLQAKQTEVADIAKSLDTLNDILSEYDDAFSLNQSRPSKTDTPPVDDNGNYKERQSPRSPVPTGTVADGDDDESLYDDAFSPGVSGDVSTTEAGTMNGHAHRSLPPPPPPHGHHAGSQQFEPARPPPCPREMYGGQQYHYIDEQQHDKKAPPPPRRDPGTRLSTTSVSSQGTYEEIPAEPSSPHHHQQHHPHHQQYSPHHGSQSPRHGSVPTVPAVSAGINKPFSYGAPMVSAQQLKHTDQQQQQMQHVPQNYPNVPNPPPHSHNGGGHVSNVSENHYNTRIAQQSPTMARRVQYDEPPAVGHMAGSPATHYGKQESVFQPQPHNPPPHGPPPPQPSGQGHQEYITPLQRPVAQAHMHQQYPGSPNQQRRPLPQPHLQSQFPGSNSNSPSQQRRAASNIENSSQIQRRPSTPQSPVLTQKPSQRSKSVPCGNLESDCPYMPAPPPPVNVRENYIATAQQMDRAPSPPLPPPPPELLEDFPPPLPPSNRPSQPLRSQQPLPAIPVSSQQSIPASMHSSPLHQPQQHNFNHPHQQQQQQYSHRALPPPPADHSYNPHQQQHQQFNHQQQHIQAPSSVSSPPPPPPLSSIPKKAHQKGGHSNAPSQTGVPPPAVQQQGGGHPGAPPAPPPVSSREQSPGSGFLADISKVQLKKTEGEATPTGTNKTGKIELSGVKLRPTAARAKLLEKDGIQIAPEEPPVEEVPHAEPPALSACPPEAPVDKVPPAEPQPGERDDVSPTKSLFAKFEQLGGAGSKDSKMGDITIDDIDLNDVPGYTPITKSTPIWKRDVIEKKNREKIEEYIVSDVIRNDNSAMEIENLLQEEKRREKAEAERWKNVPAWKRQIMMEKEKEKKVKQQEDKCQQALRESLAKGDYLMRYRLEADEAERLKAKRSKDAEAEKKAKIREQQELERKMEEEMQDIPAWKREIMLKKGNIKNWEDERADINEQELADQQNQQEVIEPPPKEPTPPPEPPKSTSGKSRSTPSKVRLPAYMQPKEENPPPAKNQAKKETLDQSNPNPLYTQKATLVLTNKKEEVSVEPAPTKAVEEPKLDEDDWESMPSWKREIMMKKGGAIRNWGDERAEVNEGEQQNEH